MYVQHKRKVAKLDIKSEENRYNFNQEFPLKDTIKRAYFDRK